MFLNELTPTNNQRISKSNAKLLNEHNIKIRPWAPKKKFIEALQKINENIIRIRNSNKQFHLDPEYAKFLNVKDVIDLMLSENLYAESPAYLEMKSMVESSVRELMDTGYTIDEACSECMNRFRRDGRFAHSDDVMLPMVQTAAREYLEGCGAQHEGAYEGLTSDVKEGLAQETGVTLDDDLLEQKVATMAKASDKSTESVIKFLNSLAEGDLVKGIQMFGKYIAEKNEFNKVRKQAVKENKLEFDFNGKTYPIEENKIVRFDQLTETVDIEQAEVVMAVRAIIDDLQDQIEKTGRTINEDIPAIATQMKTEMGASTAMQFKDSAENALQAQMEATKAAKEQLEAAVAAITGEDPGMGDMGELEDPLAGPDGDVGMDPLAPDANAIDMNEPSMMGPEGEPLGRAPTRPELEV